MGCRYANFLGQSGSEFPQTQPRKSWSSPGLQDRDSAPGMTALHGGTDLTIAESPLHFANEAVMERLKNNLEFPVSSPEQIHLIFQLLFECVPLSSVKREWPVSPQAEALLCLTSSQTYLSTGPVIKSVFSGSFYCSLLTRGASIF